nr:DUF5053 domain-containing protein [uncultured Porphyromonas sp.]DAT50982.1 MAG TPA: protein of unknown function (DUF5053) [Caudoviricetes sp.]
MNEVITVVPVKVAEQLTVKQKVSDILLDISWRGLARRYFGKSSSWMYHKMDGIYSGNNTGFTEQEQVELKGALCDLADRIRRCADTL